MYLALVALKTSIKMVRGDIFVKVVRKWACNINIILGGHLYVLMSRRPHTLLSSRPVRRSAILLHATRGCGRTLCRHLRCSGLPAVQCSPLHPYVGPNHSTGRMPRLFSHMHRHFGFCGSVYLFIYLDLGKHHYAFFFWTCIR